MLGSALGRVQEHAQQRTRHLQGRADAGMQAEYAGTSCLHTLQSFFMCGVQRPVPALASLAGCD
jgi:hypothetical protein